MATLLLTAAGQALGGAAGLGGFGGILGKAVGALAGSTIDQTLFGSSRTIERGRVADLSVQSSNEGASLPRVYGRVRLAGQVIWATRFEEVVTEEKSGGKAGGSSSSVKVRNYSYFANFAVALCEGPIARVGRVWADGKLLETSGLNWRIYTGSETQEPDPLISAVQGSTPAYRGTAYVVFERMPLEAYGNRLPQLSFEVIRPIGALEKQVRAMTLIPGAGEFIYAPDPVVDRPRPGVSETLNRHMEGGDTDWSRSLDELQALCPNLESVALVVSWFGDDLRAGSCTIKPRVEVVSRNNAGAPWQVCGITRASAQLVSEVDGRPAFGGTPSDHTVVAAIQDLKARGLKVMLYPFLMMDIPPGNGLADPEGAAEQPAFPWRGRIVANSDPAVDAASFFGTATPAHFSISGTTVSYAGPAEWSYRRHILHMAYLAKAAGGVDSFLIGSELRGLTRSYVGGGDYPFVTQLMSLAADVKAVLGSSTDLSYSADWSEYGSHQPVTGELRFPLDPLWASQDIDFVGIDNYFAIADQRDGGDPDGNLDPYDLDVLRAGIASGEDYDWYYASDADRQAAVRTPITDGAYNKPFVYRAKDLKGWWQNAHVERVGGVELASPTAWVPQSKPIRFTELGVPAIDRGANQPNVFVDPKSSESQSPRFSRGLRDDLMQRRALEAVLSWWDDLHPDLGMGDNPVSVVYGGAMVDPLIHLWTWDARPYPAFPSLNNVWSDSGNWALGHWLNGRLGSAGLEDLIRALLADYGIAETDVRAAKLGGLLDGFTVAGPVSARQVIEPLLEAFDGTASDRGVEILLHGQDLAPVRSLGADDLSSTSENKPVVSRTRSQASELASELRLSAEDPLLDFRRRVAASRRLEGGSRQVETLDLNAVAAPSTLQQAADRQLHRTWNERERVEFHLPLTEIGLEPGDVIELSGTPSETFTPPLKLRIKSIVDAEDRRIEASRILSDLAVARGGGEDITGVPFRKGTLGKAHAFLLDLPKLADSDPDWSPRLASYASLWPGSLILMRAAGSSGFQSILSVQNPATIGTLLSDLAPGPLWVFDKANSVEVELSGGHLESRSRDGVLSGRNVLAVRSSTGDFEILQFENAELTGTRSYRLTSLLRGQRGTEAEMKAGALAGADVVLLDGDAVPVVPLSADQAFIPMTYRLVPQGRALDDEASLSLDHTASGRAALPLPPVHVRAQRTASGIELTWVRQSRIGADNWEQLDIPLGEASEVYEVDILDGGGAVLRTLSTSVPSALYANADELTDFGGPVSELTVSVFQISATAGRGLERKVTLHV